MRAPQRLESHSSATDLTLPGTPATARSSESLGLAYLSETTFSSVNRRITSALLIAEEFVRLR